MIEAANHNIHGLATLRLWHTCIEAENPNQRGTERDHDKITPKSSWNNIIIQHNIIINRVTPIAERPQSPHPSPILPPNIYQFNCNYTIKPPTKPRHRLETNKESHCCSHSVEWRNQVINFDTHQSQENKGMNSLTPSILSFSLSSFYDCSLRVIKKSQFSLV